MKKDRQPQRNDAAKERPQRGGSGQMGAQKARNSTNTGEPQETQGFRNPGHDRKPDMPEDDGGRV